MSFVDCLENRGLLRSTPFVDSVCKGAKLRDIDNAQVADFVETAEAKERLTLRGYRISDIQPKYFRSFHWSITPPMET